MAKPGWIKLGRRERGHFSTPILRQRERVELNEHVTKIFVREIARQAEDALHSKGCLDDAIARDTAKEIFRHLENFLNSATKVSLLLWPPRDTGKARGEHLRTLLKVTQRNPLQLRVARNHLQHFDDRLDKWAATTANGNYVDSNVGPLSNFRIGGDATPVLRHYDPASRIFTFRSEDFDIGKLAAEVKKISDAASAL
jgi:hypothetical protein